MCHHGRRAVHGWLVAAFSISDVDFVRSAGLDALVSTAMNGTCMQARPLHPSLHVRYARMPRAGCITPPLPQPCGTRTAHDAAATGYLHARLLPLHMAARVWA